MVDQGKNDPIMHKTTQDARFPKFVGKVNEDNKRTQSVVQKVRNNLPPIGGTSRKLKMRHFSVLKSSKRGSTSPHVA